ncbi:hypothetical protein MNBD_GAMMA18-1654 [hydrothermal vent metagenome]|uniref:Peptidase S8/S53 domain-containing protein n=1 Tax=hydrothermal vent metagenome TaxID=652676 RepID=A0A3B0Z8F0_9ZZZZ
MLLFKIRNLELYLGAVVAILLLVSCVDKDDDDDERYTVSGVITAADSSMIDSDVNDFRAPYLPNDNFLIAQVVGNPLNLAGYVNIVSAGNEGRSFLSGDRDDYFRVDLIAGQTITLTISDWSSANDLDLVVYDAQQQLVDDSLGVTSTEQVTVADAGLYYIRVNAHTGASNYILNIGASNLAVKQGFSSNSEFVEGEVVVTLKEADVVAASSVMTNKHGLKVRRGTEKNVQLWHLPDELGARVSSLKSLGVPPVVGGMTLSQQRKRETLYMIKSLVSNPLVAFAEPNYIYQTTALANDEYYARQWHYPLIHLDSAWDLLPGTQPVVVAVIDSGTLPDHPDLQGQQLATGYDFVSSVANSGDGDGLDADPTDEHDGSDYYVFHGAHVAGTIAAKSNNSLGVAGVAGDWPVKLMPLRVLGAMGGSSYDITQAIYYAAGLPNDSGIQLSGDDVASVINLSLGGSARSGVLEAAIAAAVDNGIIVVAAAGNDGSSAPFYPASMAGVVSVSAVGADKQLAPYSNYGAYIDIAAPGGNTRADFDRDGSPDGILSTAGSVVDGGVEHNYIYLQGTSMASPHVAGVVALMKTIYPAMTTDMFDAWLQSGRLTTDIGANGRDDSFGYGLIDAYKAVVEARTASGNQEPLLYASPGRLNFGLTEESLIFDVRNLGDGEPSINSPASSEAWLSVDCQRLQGVCTTDAQGLGRYVATIDRQLFSVDANYSATITFNSSVDGGSFIIPVTAQRLTPSMTADAGYIYVALFAENSNSSAYVVALAARDGQYHYRFGGVKAGRYEILAGSDSDKDSSLCDRGESCGGYPLYSDIDLLLINRSMSHLDFSVGIGLTLSSISAKVVEDGLPQEDEVKRWLVK